MKTKILTIIAAIMMVSILMSACNPSQQLPTTAPGEEIAGTILLSVNPEIEIEYDRNGLVVELEGNNADGKAIVAQYPDHKGKSCVQVVSDLVNKIYASGTFELELDGSPKNIVVKLEKGSSYPNEEFLQQVAEGVRTAVSSQGSQSSTMVVDNKDLNETGLIGLEKAKELVLAQLGLTEADFTQKEYDLDDGVYELEFTNGGVEYEYDVDGRTGKILKAETDRAETDRVETDRIDTPQPAPPTGIITAEQAKEIALQKLGVTEAQISRLKIEKDDGKYEIEFYIGTTEYDFEISVQGNILKEESETADGKKTVSSPAAAITAEQAKEIALQKLGFTEAQVRDMEVELDDGRFEVSFQNGFIEYDFIIDPATGAILHMAQERDD